MTAASAPLAWSDETVIEANSPKLAVASSLSRLLEKIRRLENERNSAEADMRQLASETARFRHLLESPTLPQPPPVKGFGRQSADIEARCRSLEEQLEVLRLEILSSRSSGTATSAHSPRDIQPRQQQQRQQPRRPPGFLAGRAGTSHSLPANLQTVLSLLKTQPASASSASTAGSAPVRQSPRSRTASTTSTGATAAAVPLTPSSSEDRLRACELLHEMHRELLELTRRYADLTRRLQRPEEKDDAKSTERQDRLCRKLEQLAQRVQAKSAQIAQFEALRNRLEAVETAAISPTSPLPPPPPPPATLTATKASAISAKENRQPNRRAKSVAAAEDKRELLRSAKSCQRRLLTREDIRWV